MKFFLQIFVFFLGIASIYGEGSKQLRVNDLGNPDPSNTLTLKIFDFDYNTPNISLPQSDPDQRIHFSIKDPSEIVYIGFGNILGAPQNTNFSILDASNNVVEPNSGYVPDCRNLPMGQVGNTAFNYPSGFQAISKGPNDFQSGGRSIIGGYQPVTEKSLGGRITQLPQGDYYIRFETSPSKGARLMLPLWDISIYNPVKGKIQEGRVWSKVWPLSTTTLTTNGNITPSLPTNAKMFVYTNDRVVSSFSFNGMMMGGNDFMVNSTGPTQTGNPVVDRASRNVTFQTLRSQGILANPEFKIFLNKPDISIFTPAKFSKAYLTGCNKLGKYSLKVDANGQGSIASVFLDLNNNGIFDANIDYNFPNLNLQTGSNTILSDWALTYSDGITKVPKGVPIKVYANYVYGKTNLAHNNPSNNFNGLLVQFEEPVPTDTAYIYWDDSQLNPKGTGTALSPDSTLTGTTNRSWSGRSNKTMNTWWYLKTTDITELSLDNPSGYSLPKDTVILKRKSVVFSPVVQGDSARFNYTWSKDGNIIGNNKTLGFSSTTDSTTLVLTLEDLQNPPPDGCPDTSISLKVKTLEANFKLSKKKVCTGDTISLFYLGSSTATSQYQFDQPSTLIGTGRGPYILSYANAGMKRIKLQVSFNTGLVDEFTDSIEVMAKPNLRIQGLSADYCLQSQADTLILYPNFAKWSIANTFRTDTLLSKPSKYKDSTVFVFNPFSVGVGKQIPFTLSYQLQNVCAGSITQFVNVHAMPDVALDMPNPLRICQNALPYLLKTKFKNSENIGTGAWKIPQDTSLHKVLSKAGNNLFRINPSLLPIGTYALAYTFVSTSSPAACIDTLWLRVEVLPVPTLGSVTTKAASSCIANDGQIKVAYSISPAAYQYRWYKDFAQASQRIDSSVSFVSKDTIPLTGVKSGSYFLGLTNLQNCSLMSGPFQVDAPGIPKLKVLPHGQQACAGETILLKAHFEPKDTLIWKLANGTQKLMLTDSSQSLLLNDSTWSILSKGSKDGTFVLLGQVKNGPCLSATWVDTFSISPRIDLSKSIQIILPSCGQSNGAIKNLVINPGGNASRDIQIQWLQKVTQAPILPQDPSLGSFIPVKPNPEFPQNTPQNIDLLNIKSGWYLARIRILELGQSTFCEAYTDTFFVDNSDGPILTLNNSLDTIGIQDQSLKYPERILYYCYGSQYLSDSIVAWKGLRSNNTGADQNTILKWYASDSKGLPDYLKEIVPSTSTKISRKIAILDFPEIKQIIDQKSVLLSPLTVTYFLRETGGACDNFPTYVKIVIFPSVPTPSTQALQRFCTQDSIKIQALGDNIQWFTDTTQSFVSSGNRKTIAPSLTSTNGSLWLNQNRYAQTVTPFKGCTSPFFKVNYVVQTRPVANFSLPDSSCQASLTSVQFTGSSFGTPTFKMGKATTQIPSNNNQKQYQVAWFYPNRTNAFLDTIQLEMSVVYQNPRQEVPTLTCTSKTQKSIKILPQPRIQMPLDTHICSNLAPFSIQNYSPLGGVWSGQGVSSSGIFSPSRALPSSISLIYTFTDLSGCQKTANTIVNIDSLTPLQVLTSSKACVNDTALLLNALPQGGIWKQGNVRVDSLLNPSTLGAGTSLYQYAFTNGLGCTSDTSFNLMVHDLDSVSIMTSDTGLCASSSRLQLAGATPLGGAWSEKQSGLTTQSIDPTSLGIGVYAYRYTFVNVHGCSSYADKTYRILANPDVRVTLQNPTCSNSNGRIVLQNIPPNVGAISVSWISHPQLSGYTADQLAEDLYTIRILDQSTQCFSVKNITLVNQGIQPKADFETQPSVSEPILAATPILFIDKSLHNDSSFWFLGDGQVSRMKNTAYSYTVPGNYCIQLIASNGLCKDTSSKKCIEVLPQTLANVFTPNGDGVNDVFYFKLGSISYTFEVYNRWGRKVFSGDQNHPWDGENTSDGMYFYEAKIQDKLIKGSIQLMR